MGEFAARVEESVDFLRRQGVGEPRAAIVTGNVEAGPELRGPVAIPWDEIPGFPRGAPPGFVVEFGAIRDVPVLALRGRLHYYEGVDLPEATFPVRVARGLGARWIGLTDVAGGIDPAYEVGDIVLLSDHLNLMGDNPLIGPNEDSFGPRFPDMSGAYDPVLAHRAEGVARAAGMSVRRGVYAAVPGPTAKTPAELRFLRLVGADLVGTAIVPDTIVAVHGGMKVVALAVIGELAFPESAHGPAGGGAGGGETVAAAASAMERILTGVIREEQ